MRKIILNLCCSLDSFIEGSTGEIDWCLTDQDYGMSGFLEAIDTIYFGRKSYEQLLELAPEAFANKKKVVFSESLKSKENGIEVISGNWESKVRNQLKLTGKNIWLFGGASLVQSFLKAKLIDEMLIAVHPIILGSGKPLFESINERIELDLIQSKAYSTGLVQLHYRVKN